MWLAIIVGIMVVGVLLTFWLISRDDSTDKLNRRERAELYSLRQLVIELDDLAYAHRELDSVLAPQIIDEIRKQRRAIE